VAKSKRDNSKGKRCRNIQLWCMLTFNFIKCVHRYETSRFKCFLYQLRLSTMSRVFEGKPSARQVFQTAAFRSIQLFCMPTINYI
jgi:hypothetical protein